MCLTGKLETYNFMYVPYIIKMKKANHVKKDLPLSKNDITNNLEPQKTVIYSSTNKFC